MKSRARPRKRNPLRKFAGWESGSELPHSKAAQARSTSELTMDLIPPPFTGFPHRRRSAVPAALVLVLLASLFCSTIAWSAQQDSAQLYEGLNVSTIDLVAQPTVNVEDLRPLVAQKADTPYSTAAIQKSAEALEGTGKFTKVEVEVKPEAKGLRVTFILEPAFYVGMIYFPGATKVFSYQRLLQVVNYPAQEPYRGGPRPPGESSAHAVFRPTRIFRGPREGGGKTGPGSQAGGHYLQRDAWPAGKIWRYSDHRAAARRGRAAEGRFGLVSRPLAWSRI